MLNKIIIHGRITHELELRKTKDKTSVLNFSVAVADDYDKETTTFFNVTAWGKSAEVITDYMDKGSEIVVEGKMLCNTWKDDDGNNRYNWYINLETFNFCGSAKTDDDNKTTSRNKKGGYRK